MKKKIAVLFLAGCLGLTGVGSISVYADEQQAEEASTSETEEGFTTEMEHCTKVVSWCKNEENNIYGQFYYPENFDENQKYPVIIMSHGIGSTSQLVEDTKWPEKATQEGYVVYSFDFCGGAQNSRSDMDFVDMTVLTEVSDLNAVIDFVKGKNFVDTDKLYLMGQSQGGFVSALTAAERADEIKAMVLVYPAFCIVDDMHKSYPSLDDITTDEVEMPVGTVGAEYVTSIYDMDVWDSIGKYKGDVMLIHGNNDPLVPYTYSEDALNKAYSESNSELLLVGGEKATHVFEMDYDEGREYAEDQAMEFLKRH